jgi:Fe2+ transport system protein FeoA
MNVSLLKIASEKRFGAPPPNPGADPLASFTLDRLAVGQEAVVDSVDGEPVARRRLLEAGFVAGSRVRFLMATPFGDPLVFSLRGTSIALRRTDARHVRVRI